MHNHYGAISRRQCCCLSSGRERFMETVSTEEGREDVGVNINDDK